MFDKLEDIERKFIHLEDSLLQPGLDGKELIRLTKERAALGEVVEGYRIYRNISEQLKDAEVMAVSDDSELRALAREEIDDLSKQLEKAKEDLTLMMLPTDPRDGKNAILEIRAGTGGDEAGIFCGDLYRMYSRYAEKKGWRLEIMNMAEAAKGGFKEIIVLITGQKVFSRLKYEMGVHRVQRVPVTEAQGRIHTSACTVAVLAEAEDVEIDINPADLRIDTYRSSGSGGQHVNTTDSAVRITHVPTGVIAECQDERSQHKNREKAMKMLKSRILEQIQKTQDAEISADRKAQVGSGDRSERIRTYNFPQGRMTDHRIGLTLYRLDEIMNGDVEEIFDALGAFHKAELLKQQSF